MHVLQITTVLSGAGGVERFVDRSTRELLAAGHEVVVATSDPRAGCPYPVLTIPDLLTSAGAAVALERLDTLVQGLQPDVVVLHHIGDPELVRRLSRTTLTVEFVHVYLCDGAKLFRRSGRHCAHAIGPRCLLDWYLGPCGSTSAPSGAWRSLAAARRHLESLHLAHRVLVLSGFMLDYLVGEGISAERISVLDLSSGVGSRTVRAARPSPRPVVDMLFVGRLVSYKGAQDAITALLHLPEGFRLTLVGEGWYAATLQRLVARLRLGARVRFTGRLDEEDVTRRLAEADLLLIPSLWPEPAGIVLGEARAQGLPVVAYASGALSELSRGDPGIRLVPRAHPVALAEAARAVAGGPDVPRSCVQNLQRPSFTQALVEMTAPARAAQGRPACSEVVSAPHQA